MSMLMMMYNFFKKKPTLEQASVIAPAVEPKTASVPKDASALNAKKPVVSNPELTIPEQEAKEKAAEIMKKLRSVSPKSKVELQLTGDPVSITGSKLGGIPYLPKDGTYPADRLGRQLRLLAQIRLSELPPDSPLSGLSASGMLQFWILDDDVWGLEDSPEDMIKNDISRVVYYDRLDESVTEEECAAKYAPWSAEDETYFPLEGEFGIRFQKTCQEGISVCDFSFDPLFTESWNREYPQYRIASVFDLPDEAAESIFEEDDNFGHKIGGYPAFTQEDPRGEEEQLERYTVLLLQIDSGEADGREIMWGDCGVANFFITPEDLAAQDFSRVLYTWDCC